MRTILYASCAIAILLAQASMAAQTNSLKILVIAGEDAVNVIQQKTAVAPIVEVRESPQTVQAALRPPRLRPHLRCDRQHDIANDNDHNNYDDPDHPSTPQPATNNTPVITSATITPNVALIGLDPPIALQVQASDAANDQLTYLWEFPDGSRGDSDLS